jgi:hypothetical protein
MNRRTFLAASAIGGAGLLTGSTTLQAAGNSLISSSPDCALRGNRFVTLCIMIRTTPWEVSRDVKLHPRDEST